jgi:prepilin-type N-terminal cleavage/methylation domain-containing protein
MMETNAMTQRSERDRGYSLVEVLIALAITSIVLLTVVTLFYMGRRNVYSGKQMTYAVSVGTRILEDLSSMAMTDLETNFNITDNLTPSTVGINGLGGGPAAGSGVMTFTNSAGGGATYTDSSGSSVSNSFPIGTTTCTGSGSPVVYTCTNDTGGYLAKWRALIDESKLANAQVGLIVTPRSPANPTGCNPCLWTTARYLKVRAYVSWEEAQNRRRIAIFDTTKVNRQ